MREPKFITGTVERLALLYSDNSAGILHEGCTVQDADAERQFSDKNERESAHRTRVARVRVTIIEVIDAI